MTRPDRTPSRVPLHTLDSAPAVARPVLEALAQRSPTPGRPLNLHAQMAHAPAVLLGYMGLRRALDDHGTLERKTRTALLLTVAAAEECAYTVALNTLIAQQAGWEAGQLLALRKGHTDDPKLAALLGLARQSALNRGRVDEATWQAARAAGWTEAELAEAFAFVGLTQYVDAFVNFARTELDPALARLAADPSPADNTATLTATSTAT